MSLKRTDLIIHPIRLRIIEAASNRALTTRNLAALLPDVPQATLYRQIHRLVEGGLLRVVEERVVNGIIEKTYIVPAGAAHIDREEFSQITAEEHARYFPIFMGTMANSMTRYIEQETFDAVREGMTYFQASLYLTDEEARQLRVDLLEFVNRNAGAPGPGRRLRSLNVAFIPEGPESGKSQEEDESE